MAVVMLAGCSDSGISANPLDPQQPYFVGQEATNEIYNLEASLKSIAAEHGYEIETQNWFCITSTSAPEVEEIKTAESLLKETAQKHGIFLKVSYTKL